jgi:hypothetical protein
MSGVVHAVFLFAIMWGLGWLTTLFVSLFLLMEGALPLPLVLILSALAVLVVWRHRRRRAQPAALLEDI